MMSLPVWLPGPMFLPGRFCPGGICPGGLYRGGLPSGIRKAGGTHLTGMLPSLMIINLFQVMKQPVLKTGLSNGTSNSTGTLNTVSDIVIFWFSMLSNEESN